MHTIGLNERGIAWIERDGERIARVCTAGRSADEVAAELAEVLVRWLNANDGKPTTKRQIEKLRASDK